jgi:diketogulonate reductase-like aldo/keto reductase
VTKFRALVREELVGKAISELETKHAIPRTSLWIQTKYTPIGGQDTTKPLPYDPKASIEEQVKSSVETSLRQLGVDYLDGLLLHSPLPTFEVSGLGHYRPLLSLPALTTLSNFRKTNKRGRHLNLLSPPKGLEI